MAKINSNTKTNKNIFGPKKEDIIKDLLELKNTLKSSTINTKKTLILMIEY